MIKPISSVTTKVTSNQRTLIRSSFAKERITALIKDFEECLKSSPNNIALKNHIESLKEALKKYQ